MLWVSNPHFKKIYINVQKGIIFVMLALFSSCLGPEKSEQERLREQNAKGEYVYRYHDEKHYPLTPLVPREKADYPWEKEDKTAEELKY